MTSSLRRFRYADKDLQLVRMVAAWRIASNYSIRCISVMSSIDRLLRARSCVRSPSLRYSRSIRLRRCDCCTELWYEEEHIRAWLGKQASICCFILAEAGRFYRGATFTTPVRWCHACDGVPVNYCRATSHTQYQLHDLAYCVRSAQSRHQIFKFDNIVQLQGSHED